jgi:hypothetical protein
MNIKEMSYVRILLNSFDLILLWWDLDTGDYKQF